MIYFGTATLQRCNSECRAELAPAMPSASSLDGSQRCSSESRAELAPAMPSASSLDEVNTATARAEIWSSS